MEVLNNKEFFDEFILIQHNKDNVVIGERTNHIKMNYKEFHEWFKQKNNESNQNNTTHSNSKQLNSATNNIGDPYVQGLLNEIYVDKYNNLDFNTDDNGLEIVSQTLNNESTYGFDFDLFEPTQGIIIEFLKRESEYITNLTSHPTRYAKNKRKFISLWNAAKRVNNKSPSLFLINYSDDPNEPIQLIIIRDFDTNLNSNKMVLSDIGYKLDGKEELLSWLKVLNTNTNKAMEYLDNLPKQERDYHFFNNVYFNKKKIRNWKEI